MSLWRTRIITAFAVLFVTLVIGYFVDAENRILALTNTTFFVGLMLLMISTLLFISVNWIFKVFTYNRSIHSGMDPTMDYGAANDKSIVW